MNDQLNPRFMERVPHIQVAGYAPVGPLYLGGGVGLTSRILTVPGNRLMSPSGATTFFEPDPEWLREQGAVAEGEYWLIVEKTCFGAQLEYRVPAMWGLWIDLERARRSRQL